MQDAAACYIVYHNKSGEILYQSSRPPVDMSTAYNLKSKFPDGHLVIDSKVCNIEKKWNMEALLSETEKKIYDCSYNGKSIYQTEPCEERMVVAMQEEESSIIGLIESYENRMFKYCNDESKIYDGSYRVHYKRQCIKKQKSLF